MRIPAASLWRFETVTRCTRVASTNGGGYDMRGAVLGMWLTKEYQAEISRLPANYGSMDKREGFYGLVHSEKGVTYGTLHTGTAKSKSYVDGMCGQSSVARIAAAIGVDWFEAKKSR